MIRSCLLIIVSVIITAFMSGCAIIFPLISPGENKSHKIAHIWAKILLILTNTRVKVVGEDNIISQKPYIFMANHQSDFDILILLAHVPGQFRWIVKKELFHIPLFGPAMRKAGYIEMDRQNHKSALRSIEKAARKIRDGKSVMSFPEGTRSKDGKIEPFKQGMFYLAIKAGVPIIPISIVGANYIMPKRSLRINPGKITLVIGNPIETCGYTIENRHALIEKVRNVIINNYEEYGNQPG
jgi:1-acyl-sn-glycerol-3-phosphate acyltransferase